MDFTHLSHWAGGAGLMAILAAAAAGWSRVKSFSSYVMSALVLHREVNVYALTSVLKVYVRAHYTKLPSGKATYNYLYGTVDNRSLLSFVPFEIPNAAGIWKGAHGVFYMNFKGEGTVTLLSLRGFSNPQALIIAALEMNENIRNAEGLNSCNSYKIIPVMGTIGASLKDQIADAPKLAGSGNAADVNRETAIGTHSWYEPEERVDKSFMYANERWRQNTHCSDPMRGLFFPDDVKRVLAWIQTWYDNSRYYQAHAIPWRTGVLLWGPGGTGKSSVAKAAAQQLGLPLYQYYLNTFTDHDFVKKWGEMETPCMVALEDFDTVFHGRESMTPHRSLSFECVLNQISGISSLNGVCLFVTTNHIEHIDEALGRIGENGLPTRPGRIDMILRMGETTEQQRREIAQFTLDDEGSEFIEQLVKDFEGATAAQFQSQCVQIALERLSPKLQEFATAPIEEASLPLLSLVKA